MSTERVVTTSTDSLSTGERSSADARDEPAAVADAERLGRFAAEIEQALRDVAEDDLDASRSRAPKPISPSPQPTSSSVSPGAGAAAVEHGVPHLGEPRDDLAPDLLVAAETPSREPARPAVLAPGHQLPARAASFVPGAPGGRAVAADGQVEVEPGELLDRPARFGAVGDEHRHGFAEGLAGHERVAADDRRSQPVGDVARRVAGRRHHLQPTDHLTGLEPAIDRRHLDGPQEVDDPRARAGHEAVAELAGEQRPLGRRCADRSSGRLADCIRAARVVEVAVREQDQRRLDSCSAQLVHDLAADARRPCVHEHRLFGWTR